MSLRSAFLRNVGVAAGAASALAVGALGYALRRPLPQVDGEVRVRGVSAQVEIVRDRWGVPHIYGRDANDACFGLGYAHAQDRLWQMDLNRRIARGELSEVFGAVALDVDRFFRRVGLHRAARREWDALDGETRASLEAYSAGANAAIDALIASGRLPVEYALLRFQPRRWQPLDSLSFGRYMAFTQSPNWETELIRSRLIARLGYLGAAALEPDVWQAESDAIPRLADWGPPDFTEVESPLSGLAGPPGSNNWVVSGARSSTGKPLLATDPHLFPRVPAVFYEAQIAGGVDLNVAGATLPGAPGVVIGHNRDIAWGVTSSMVDVQDFFVERLDPGSHRRTEFAGRWEAGTVVREEIVVKGRAKPFLEEVLITQRHGPLVTPTPALPDEHRPLALRSSVLEGGETAVPLMMLNRAQSWEQFREALSHWSTPSLNMVYADVAGNIGYQMCGQIPIRARGEGLVPSPGWGGQYEWTGWIPFAELPSVLNPPDGLWATANHRTTLGSRHFFTREYIGPHRYRRIRGVLEARERHSAVDFSALQADLVTLAGREVAQHLAQNLNPRVPLERRAVDALRRWDGRATEDSAAAAIYHMFVQSLLAELHGPALGDMLPAIFGEGPHPVAGPVTSFYFLYVERALATVRRWAAGDAAAEEGQAVERAFAATVRDLAGRFGPNLDEWQWGKLHTLKLEHALSVQKPLGVLLDIPPFRTGGDAETVRAVGLRPNSLEAGGPTAGYRLIADTADWDASLSCIPGGQSGQRGSPHYADQVEDWRRVAYHPLTFTRPAVLRHARHTLRLTKD